MPLRIRPVEPRDADAWTALRCALLPDASPTELADEVRVALAGAPRSSLPLATLVADDDGRVVGYAEVGLRSHAEGCDPRRPVGYLEEWFVVPGARGRGVGAALVRAAEDWARAQGCTEMASDTLASNRVSRRAHAALGYERVEPEPVISFRKRL